MYVCCIVFVVCVYVRVVMTSKPPSLTEMIKCLVQQFSVAFTIERERERERLSQQPIKRQYMLVIILRPFWG